MRGRRESLGGGSVDRLLCRLLGKFREQLEDGRRGLEELDGGAVSKSRVAAFAGGNESPNHLSAETNRLAGSPQFHLAYTPRRERALVFDQKSERTDIHRLERRDLAEADLQAFLWSDALGAPALPTRLGGCVGNNREPSQLNIRQGHWTYRARNPGMRRDPIHLEACVAAS